MCTVPWTLARILATDVPATLEAAARREQVSLLSVHLVLYGAYVDGEPLPVATFGYQPLRGFVRINGIYTRPSWRKRGLMQSMFTHLWDEIRQVAITAGHRRVEANATAGSLGMFLRHNFVPVKRWRTVTRLATLV